MEILQPAGFSFGLSDAAEVGLLIIALSALNRARTSLGTDEEIAELLEQGRYEEALEVASRAVGIPLAGGIAAAYVLAGQRTAKDLEDAMNAPVSLETSVTIGFDQSHTRAVAFMQEERLRLIREFTNAARDATRAALQDGIERGLNPVAQARQFRGAIGLTEYQENMVRNFRSAIDNAENRPSDVFARELRDRRFDPSIERAARTDTPLSAEHKDRMVFRYRERLLKFRAETIARTEALRATHAGIHEAFNQSVESGTFDVGEIERTWNATRDRRVRKDHAAAHGQKRGLNETFLVGGYALLFPCDPNGPASQVIKCRCGVATRIVIPEAA